MPDITRDLESAADPERLTLTSGKDSGVEGFPMREWNIRIVLVNEITGEDVQANVFEKATYKLHPTFGARETQGTFPLVEPKRYYFDVPRPL
ncbi:MAG: hypothetical protein LQ344_005937 [Seirophora lacunosa]|nr:MAG: hypothetical protein LQ344_005937 [Seirophora lacunosa]